MVRIIRTESYPKVRGDARPTSRDAAKSMEGRTGKQRMAVLKAIEDAGALGLTDEQIVDILEINPSSARPRRLELLEAGLITEAGTRKTKSGRSATIWVAV